jgi:hypothetical protein
MRRVWTAADRRDIAQAYVREGAYALAERLGRSANSVCSQARRFGLRSAVRRAKQGDTRVRSNRTVNARFFGRVTPDVAFTLGFIWASGSIRTKHRHVLRLVCHEERVDRLNQILTLLESKHQLQQYGTRIVVELGNSHLVQSLIDGFGLPPGRRSAGTLPRLDGALTPHFASGHLFATGISNPQCVCWRGHPRVVRWLADQIQVALPVSSPRVSCWGNSMSAAWTQTGDIQAIRTWLEISKLV